jgi:chemotaxis protein MotA
VDIATLTGILVGFALTFGAVVLGALPGTFAYISGLVFVLGGTCAAILLTFPASDVGRAIHAGIRTLFVQPITARDAVTTMVHLADISRKEGIAALEKIHTPNPALKKAAQLIADNADPDHIYDALDMEILSLRHYRDHDLAVFSRLAFCAPVVGMLGTLVRLIQILATHKNPEAFGPETAMALMASFYGCLLSTLIFLPIAGRIRARSMQEKYRLIIIFEGANCILENNNPKLVHERLSSFLPHKERAGAG